MNLSEKCLYVNQKLFYPNHNVAKTRKVDPTKIIAALVHPSQIRLKQNQKRAYFDQVIESVEVRIIGFVCRNCAFQMKITF